MIHSVRVILCRALLGVLDDRGIRIHALAQAPLITIVDLRRLLEFGSLLDTQAAERLIAWGMRTIVVSRAKARMISLNRIGAKRVRPHVSLA